MKNATIERETLWRVVEKEWVDDEGFTVVSCDVYQDGVHVGGEWCRVVVPALRSLVIKETRRLALECAGVFG